MTGGTGSLAPDNRRDDPRTITAVPDRFGPGLIATAQFSHQSSQPSIGELAIKIPAQYIVEQLLVNNQGPLSARGRGLARIHVTAYLGYERLSSVSGPGSRCALPTTARRPITQQLGGGTQRSRSQSLISQHRFGTRVNFLSPMGGLLGNWNWRDGEDWRFARAVIVAMMNISRDERVI